jgi:predicted alpha/beta-hydrolase family hydrolase
MSEWSVPVGDAHVSAVYEPATTDTQLGVFVCAHGAGGNMSDRGMLTTANTMRKAGLGVVRFNFLYKERKSGRPDAMPLLGTTTDAVVTRARAELAPSKVFIGGRSMGGRAASMMAADGYNADGLILLAYPLHPAGQPEKLRDAHLPRITMPVLCFNGTRDALCTPELMERALKAVKAPWRMQWEEGADHSFHVLKSSGRTDSQVMESICDVTARWIAAQNV